MEEKRPRGRPKKTAEAMTASAQLLDPQTEEIAKDCLEAAEPKVMILSLREGDLILKEGLLRKNEMLEVDLATAETLMAGFPGSIKIL
jgi:hypothetical protein